MSALATVVEWGDLLKVIWVSLAAGIGVTAVFALAIVGATGFVDYRRDGRMLGAGTFAVLAVVALAFCAVAVVFGIVAVTAK